MTLNKWGIMYFIFMVVIPAALVFLFSYVMPVYFHGDKAFDTDIEVEPKKVISDGHEYLVFPNILGTVHNPECPCRKKERD